MELVNQLKHCHISPLNPGTDRQNQAVTGTKGDMGLKGTGYKRSSGMASQGAWTGGRHRYGNEMSLPDEICKDPVYEWIEV